MAVPSVPNVGLQRVMARNAARGAAHKLVHTDTSNLKKLDRCVQEPYCVDWTRPDGSVEPFQIPAEPELTTSACCICSRVLPADHRSAACARTKSPSTIRHRRACVAKSDDLGSLVVKLSLLLSIRATSPRRAAAHRQLKHRQLQERWAPPPRPRASPCAH